MNIDCHVSLIEHLKTYRFNQHTALFRAFSDPFETSHDDNESIL